MPPEIFVKTPVAPVKPNDGEVVQPPELQTLTVPPDWVYVMNVFALVEAGVEVQRAALDGEGRADAGAHDVACRSCRR